MKKTSCKRGFTLIELLVVVLIIGILAAVAVPQYQKAVEKAWFTQALTSMDALRKACEVYHLANGAYPTALSQLDIDPNLPKGYILGLFHSDGDRYFAIDMHIYRHGQEILEYVYFLQWSGNPSQRKECRVWEDKPIFHQLCQSVSGKTTGYEGTGYTYYFFE